MSDDFTTHEGVSDAIWSRLIEAGDNPKAPARHVTLATMRATTGPAARLVVLRGAHRAQATLAFYTHAHSTKLTEIAKDPNVEVLVWDPDAMFQVRLSGRARVSDGPDELWDDMSDDEHQNYAFNPSPGAPLLDAEHLMHMPPMPDPSLFKIITVEIMRMDAVQLGRDVHRRVVFARDPDAKSWQSAWIVP